MALPAIKNMEINADLNWVNITPEEGHYAFGYYDRCPWDSGNQRHLAIRMPQQTRLPEPGERAVVGFVERSTRRFHPLAETEAWCHQQGSMTQWLKHREGCFLFNDFRQDGDRWLPVARVFDLSKGIVDEYPFPIYVLSPNGAWGATLDFARKPRRGYSYARTPLPLDRLMPDLENDGLFVADMCTGEKRLVASYRDMLAMHPCPYDMEDVFVGLEHPMFNADSSRVLVLLRHLPVKEATQPQGWRTHLYTVNVDGSDLRCPLPDIYWRQEAISHHIWGRSPGEILVDAEWCGRGHEYVVVDEGRHPLRAERISRGMGPKSHLNFSPDGQWIAADTYPDAAGIEHLGLVHVPTGEIRHLGRFLHQTPGVVGDMRCDLHPRWSADGKILTVDSIHLGDRKIFMLEL